MAVDEHQVASPDGRTWTVETSKHWHSLRESGEVPYFLTHVVVTTLMVVVFLVVFKSDIFKVLSVMIVLVFLLWLIGFVSSHFQITVTADTVGPPVDHRRWVVTKQRHRNRYVHELQDAIRNGQDAKEPEGTRLLEI